MPGTHELNQLAVFLRQNPEKNWNRTLETKKSTQKMCYRDTKGGIENTLSKGVCSISQIAYHTQFEVGSHYQMLPFDRIGNQKTRLIY